MTEVGLADARPVEKRRPDRSALVDDEVPFSFDELFFSRTDERGVILSGNAVFCRVSRFDWKDMENRPHRIVRHPDMPAAVFHLLWETIRAGKPMAAYVKNRASDGCFYWVLAIVTPVDGGYLSVRIKPGSGLFSQVIREYRDLLAAERSERLSPAESAGRLLARLEELGFAGYGAFMAAALSAETAARNEALARAADPDIPSFDLLAGQAKSLIALADGIFEAYLSNEHVPLNLRIHAGQLGERGAPIGVISTNYGSISDEIRGEMADFVKAANRVHETVTNGLSLCAIAGIQAEMLHRSRFERSEERSEGEDGRARVCDSDLELLDAQRATYRARAREGLEEIAREARRFRDACFEMRRLEIGLEVTRIMGKIECAHLDTTIEELDGLIQDLAGFQSALAEGLQRIEKENRLMLHRIERMLAAASRTERMLAAAD